MKIIKLIFEKCKLLAFLHIGRMRSYFYKTNKLNTPDRNILENLIFPELCGGAEKKILFVGCEWYTSHYKEFFNNHEFWTMDFNKAVERFGAVNHIVDKLENIDNYFDDGVFDIIICNGILGFGTDSSVDAEIVFLKCYQILKNKGILLLGWNKSSPDKLNDPRHIKSLSKFSPLYFDKLGKKRYEVGEGSSHIFDFYSKP